MTFSNYFEITITSSAMSRVLLLTSFILLHFFSNGLAEIATSFEVDGLGDVERTDFEDEDNNDQKETEKIATSFEVDGLEDVERTDFEDEEEQNKEKVNLLGVDYFTGMQDNSENYMNFNNYHYNKLAGSPEIEESIEQLRGKGGEIVILDSMDTRNYKAETNAGNKADVLGVNPHYYQPDVYPDFGRRFVPQYPYTEVAKKKLEVEPNSMTPKLVSPELFMAVAQKSALLDAARPKGYKDEFLRKDILRNGDYWNAVWKEDVNPLVLRTKQTKKLESVKAEIPPGSKLYDLLSKLKHLSPTLLYVINERDS